MWQTEVQVNETGAMRLGQPGHRALEATTKGGAARAQMWWEALHDDAQGETCSDFHVRSSLQELSRDYVGEGCKA